MATSNIVHIQIDPKTARLAEAIHGILIAARTATDALPNETIKEIDVNVNYVKVKTADSSFIAMIDDK
jgi:hypothetical protein